jgi:hypothetical protein
VFHEPLLEGTKVKSLVPGEGIELSSTSDLVTIAVAENLAVSRLTPRDDSIEIKGGLEVEGLSQFAGVEAAGVVAEQVVWVTGDGAPAQSIMFPGSLQLGQWRLRAVDSGAVVEWFSSASNAWTQVTSFETAGQQADRLRADTLLIGPRETGIEGIAAVIDGKLRVLDSLETTGRLRADTLAPFFQGAVRVASGLDVEGPLSVEGTNVLSALGGKQAQLTQGGFGTELLYDSNKLKRVQFGSGLVGGTDLQPDGSQNVFVSVSPDLSVDSLTVGGVNVANALAASEPAFAAVAPLQKAVNFQTGQLELRVDTAGLGNPFWAAGTIASNGDALSKKGRVDFTCLRTAAGNYRIAFAEPHPDGAVYVIGLTSFVFFAQVNGSIVPTAGEFRVRLINGNLQDTDAQFYFSVLA